SFGAFVDPPAAHHLHLGAAIHLAQVVDQLAHGGDGAGEGAYMTSRSGRCSPMSLRISSLGTPPPPNRTFQPSDSKRSAQSWPPSSSGSSSPQKIRTLRPLAAWRGSLAAS